MFHYVTYNKQNNIWHKFVIIIFALYGRTMEDEYESLQKRYYCVCRLIYFNVSAQTAKNTCKKERPSRLSPEMTVDRKSINWWTNSCHRAFGYQTLWLVGEGLHGVGRDGRIPFSQPIGLGATFEPMLIQEHRWYRSFWSEQKYNAGTRLNYSAMRTYVSESPNVNIFRDPRWEARHGLARPVHIQGTLGTAYVQGMQKRSFI